MANARMSLLVMTGWIAALAGCQQLPPQAIQQIEQARGELKQRNYVKCEKTLNPVIASYQTHDGIAEALYMRGQCRLMKNQRRQGMRDLTTAQNVARDKRLRAWIEVQLGNVKFDDGSYRQARTLYESSLEELPEVPPTDRVMHQLALACERSGDRAESRRILARLKKTFPSSSYVSKSYASKGSRTSARNSQFAMANRSKRNHSTSLAARSTSSRSTTSRTRTPSSRSGSRSRFEVQCGAYARIDHAHQAAARLRQQGFDALAIPERRGGAVKHVVRVGRYDNYRDASRMLARVRKFHTDAFIVR
ncbi:MAG: tetratricopeptide repeat protein [Planctomycetes bacterium]|nr:tetratricopeptide repeat protein [Planctomycetota bacterium]